MFKRLTALLAALTTMLVLGVSNAAAAGNVSVTVIHCGGSCNTAYITSGQAYQWNGYYYQQIASGGGWGWNFYAPFNYSGYAHVCTANGCGNAYFGPTGGNLNITI